MVGREELVQHPDVPTPDAQLEQLRIQERFVSLQGEGALVGVPSSFVRISGCNLRCGWCDTPKSSWAPEGERESIDDLIAWCDRGPRHVRTSDEAVLAADLAEIHALLDALAIAPDQRERVLLMPESTDADSLRAGYRRLVATCMQTGMRIGLRLHIELFGHTPGT